MNAETIATLLRTLLKFFGGILVAKGVLDDAALAEIIGGLMTVFGFVWGIIAARAAAKAKPSRPTTPLMALAAALSLSFVFTGCASYKAAGVVTVTAEKAMQSWASYYDAAHASPADYATTTAKLEQQRRDVDRAWEAYRFAMNAVDDTRLSGGDVQAALQTAQARSGELVTIVLTLLPQQFKPK